jgi:PhnB protein
MDVTSQGFRTLITATLSVRNGPRAIAFYKDAFGAVELHRFDGADGTAVAQLAVSGAEFWVADETPAHLNFSPESLGGCSVRMLLVVEDPDAVCRRAIAMGAKQVVPVAEEHGWRLGRILDPFGHHWEIGRQIGKGVSGDG